MFVPVASRKNLYEKALLLMSLLNELVEIISLQRLIQSRSQINENKSLQLYNLIAAGVSDEEIKAQLFSDTKKPTLNLRRAKNRLFNTLIGVLNFTPTEGKTDYKSVYSKCYLNYSAIHRLRAIGAIKTAARLAEKTFKQTSKYQITEINMGLAKILMMYSSATGDNKKLMVYNNELDHYIDLYQLEIKAGVQFFKAVSLFARKKKQSSFDYNQIKELLTEVAGYGMNSLELAQHVMRSKIFLASMRNDLMRLRQYYNEALDYLESLPFKAAPGSYYIFLNKLSPALILLGEYEKAAVNIDRCLSTRRPGGHNWHITLQYKAILAFYTKDYEQVKLIIQLYKKHNTPSSREVEGYWELIIAYAALMNEEDFKIGQFYNKTNSLFTDKSGAFASVLIVQYLLYLKSGNRDVLIDADENIRKYAANYLNTERNKRTYCMIRIIRELSVSKFVQSRFESKASAYIQELNDTPRKLEDLEVEIVPFEVLLGLVKNEFVAID